MTQMNCNIEFESGPSPFLVERSLDTEDIRNQMYEIMSLLIDRLQMVRLWGYGFPDLPLFVFVLRKYLEYS